MESPPRSGPPRQVSVKAGQETFEQRRPRNDKERFFPALGPGSLPFHALSPTFAQGSGFPLCQPQLCPPLKGRPLWKDAARLPYRVNTSDGAWTPPVPTTDHTRQLSGGAGPVGSCSLCSKVLANAAGAAGTCSAWAELKVPARLLNLPRGVGGCLFPLRPGCQMSVTASGTQHRPAPKLGQTSPLRSDSR